MSRKYLDNTGLSYFWNKVNGKKQDTLVSGTNIKTINNQSLLGSGNITISGGGGSATDVRINNTSITSNGVANISTNSTYDESSNPLATIDDVTSQGYQTAPEVYGIIEEVASSPEFTQQLVQIITALMPSGSEVTVDTFEDLPANATPYSKAYVRQATLYDIVDLMDIQFDLSLISHLSPVEEFDFTGWNPQNDYFTIDYTDYLGFEWSAGCAPFGNDIWIVMVGNTSLLTDMDVIYVYANGEIGYFGIDRAGWYLMSMDAGGAIPVDFNDVPIVSTINADVMQQSGNILRAADLFVGAKKHYAGEYRFINGQWVYQGTPKTEFVDTSLNTVPSSHLIYKTLNGVGSAFDAIANDISNIYDIISNMGGQ